MTVYQARARQFLPEREGDKLSFPGQFELDFILTPASPFGGGSDPSRTVALGATAHLEWDSRIGSGVTLSSIPLEPVRLKYPADDLNFEFNANHMIISGSAVDM